MFQNIFKNDKWVNAGNGCINIQRDLDKRSIRQILKEDNLFQVQFHSKPSIKTLDLLNEYLFYKRPDVYLRLTNYSEPLTDLSFLNSMKNLENLYLDIYDIKNFNLIGELKNLKGLILSDTKSKNISLEPISNLDELNYLSISGLKKDIDSLSNLEKVNELALRSLTLDNLNFLVKYNELEKISVALGGTHNYEALINVPKLKYLELWQVRKLKEINFISDLQELEHLNLSSLRNIVELPTFTNNKKLKKLIFETLKGLKEISSLKNLTNLEEFLFVAARNLSPEQFSVLKDCENLKMASVGFGSDKKNNEFEKMMASFGVNKYDWRKSKY